MTIKRFFLFVPKQCFHMSSSFYSVDSSKLLSDVRQFVHDEIIPKAGEFDASGKFPWDIVQKAHSLGFLNVNTSAELGGLGLDLKTKTQIFQELAYGCGTISAALMISELAQIPMLNSGSDFLKQKYVKRMLEEPILAAYATTEQEAGSDLATAKMSAIEDGDSFVLNGTKVWVSNCGLASWFFVLARTSTTASTGNAFTGFIVDRNLDGVSVGEKERTMGQKCGDLRELTLTNVRVPKENVVGLVGRGFGVAMEAFNRVRPLVASLGCGIQHRALDEATKHALERKTFGSSIIQHQAVGFKLANMAQKLEASRLLVQQAAEKIDNSDKDATYYSAIAKCFSTDAALQSSIDAIQIFGANGYSSNYPVEKLLRDANALQFMSGSNDIQKSIITRQLVKQFTEQ